MISVCMATYNGESYVREQAESILKQLGPNDELIVSDNGSSDNTISVLEELNDARIQVFTFQSSESPHRFSASHYKVSRNFENALKQAMGDYIFLTDQDDIWVRDKVKMCISHLKDGASLVYSNRSIIDGDNKVMVERVETNNPIGYPFLINCVRTPFFGCCMAFNSDLLRLAMPFPKNLIMHDNWIGLLAQISGSRIDYIGEPLLRYRRHGNNVSKTKSVNPLWFKIWLRIRLAFQVVKRYFSR